MTDKVIIEAEKIEIYTTEKKWDSIISWIFEFIKLIFDLIGIIILWFLVYAVVRSLF
jgi:type III secretory pathway component EscU